MTPKQKRLRQMQMHMVKTNVKKYIIGILLIAGVLKLLSLALQGLQSI